MLLGRLHPDIRVPADSFCTHYGGPLVFQHFSEYQAVGFLVLNGQHAHTCQAGTSSLELPGCVMFGLLCLFQRQAKGKRTAPSVHAVDC